VKNLIKRIWTRYIGKDGEWHDAPRGGMRRWLGHGWEYRDYTLEELQDRIHNGW
jgi:hypothetical protein